MSKKLVINADGLVLDVKWGKGAFMKSYKDAMCLAHLLADIAKKEGRKMSVLVTNMNQPLGNAVGNALEIKQTIQILSNNRYKMDMVSDVSCDFLNLVLELGGRMVLMAEVEHTLGGAISLLKEKIKTGEALKKFRELINNQYGDEKVVSDPERFLPTTKYKIIIKSNFEGYIRSVNAYLIGKVSMMIGAGRKCIDDEIDYGAGVVLIKKERQYVRKEDILGVLYLNDKSCKKEAEKLFLEAYDIGDKIQEDVPLVTDVVEEYGKRGQLPFS